MSTTKKKGGSGDHDQTSTDTDLPSIEFSSGAERIGKDFAGVGVARAVKPIDFENEKLKSRWQKILARNRVGVETDVLKISPPRAKLDPIAKTALDNLARKLCSRKPAHGESVDLPAREQLRTFITKAGIASEVKRVTDRLNARRMTDGRRWVLATSYEFLLAKLLLEQPNRYEERDTYSTEYEAPKHNEFVLAKLRLEEIQEFMKDDLGVAEKILLDLEAAGGPIDLFAGLLVDSVMERNRIKKSDTLVELVSQQVRAAI